jgi:hypothetical protein
MSSLTLTLTRSSVSASSWIFDTYKYLWTSDIKVIFLEVLECKKIQKCILTCEKFNFVTKISRYFVKFRNISRYEISTNKIKLFSEIRNKYLAKFREISPQRNFVDHPNKFSFKCFIP